MFHSKITKTIMTRTHYKLAFITMWRGMVIFIKSWAVTLNRLLFDILHGIRKHWFFVILLIAAYVVMFLTMAKSRALYHNGEEINYQLTQVIDSLRMVK